MKQPQTLADTYRLLQAQIDALISDETNPTAILSNVAAALHDAFPERYFWVGFYLTDTTDELVLGPFQGPVACFRIKKGRGVCGTAWQEERTLVVPNVNQFPGHIACSTLSQSEIVVPLTDSHGLIHGVLDIDSRHLNAFGDADRAGLEPVCTLLADKLSTLATSL